MARKEAISMEEYLGIKYAPVEEHFFAGSAVEVARHLIGCAFHHDSPGKDTAVVIVETEAYEETDMASHCHPAATARRRDRSRSMLLQHGHVYIHEDRGMPCLNLVCGKQGYGSAVLIRAGMPIVGLDVMTERRSAHPDADRRIRERAKGFEKHLCNGPGKLGEALGLGMQLDGAALFKSPFHILQPLGAPPRLLNGPRINVTKDADRPWRWGHANYPEWTSKPFPSGEGS
jgi:DNA-3-methyladenine glycosylase